MEETKMNDQRQHPAERLDRQDIDDLEKRFPFAPGPYYKTNPVFEGRNLPIWWS
jgi:hypothetical protein